MYNQTLFTTEFRNILSDLMESDTSDIANLEVAEPITLSTNIRPTHAPHDYQTSNEDSGKMFSITLAAIIFGICCCCIM